MEQIDAIADDAAQEATLAVLAKLSSFRGDAAFTTWASKFGVSGAAEILRRRQWRDVSLEDMPNGWERLVAELEGSDAGGQPDLITQRKEVRQLLLEVVREDLTEKQRQVIAYVLFQGVPPHEVAERIGISRGACYKLGHDARRALKRGIERRGWTCADALAAFSAPGPVIVGGG